jgi:hypothetical protein
MITDNVGPVDALIQLVETIVGPLYRAFRQVVAYIAGALGMWRLVDW